MAISDIPEYIEVAPGDLVRAEQWNGVQRQVRNGLRTHRHVRVAGALPNDTAVVDEAQQVDTSEIADGAVTAAKLAPGAITANAIPDGAITTTKLVDGAVTGAKIANNSIVAAHIQSGAITSPKLSFQTVNNGSASLGAGASTEQLVQASAPSTKTTIYFPTLSIVSSSGGGVSDVDAAMVYRQAVGANTIDVFIRLTNRGAATAGIVWQVLTFSQ
jgi:hypothetical protein